MAERTVIAEDGFDQLKSLNADWVAWIPYAFCDVESGRLQQEPAWQWQGETSKGCQRAIELAKAKGLKVMVKPHVWLSDHSFTGTMELTPEQWKTWQADYTKYILDFAELAQQYKAELFCIGTEQYSSFIHDPAYWQQLIKEVRKAYKGKIVYAANWDTYRECPFWEEVDYMGVDAYMPLSEKAAPGVKELQRDWKKWKREIAAFYRKHEKPVLFTEFGYKCCQYTTTQPWEHTTEEDYCEPCQADAYQAVFNSFWSEEWFAGGFVWKWFEPSKSLEGEGKKGFLVQGKQAEKTISKSFGLFKN